MKTLYKKKEQKDEIKINFIYGFESTYGMSRRENKKFLLAVETHILG